MTGTATTSKGYTWYPINVNGTLGYVRGDCSFKLSATQEESYLAGNGVPDENNSSGGGTATASTYLITVLDKVNLRASPSKDANAPYNIPLGTVMAYNNQQTVGGSLWYRVVYDNTQVWVLGSCVSVMTQAEYEEWLATQPTTTPQPEVVVGYVVTVTGGVNLRTTANGSQDHRPPGRGRGHAVQRRAYRAARIPVVSRKNHAGHRVCARRLRGRVYRQRRRIANRNPRTHQLQSHRRPGSYL